MRGDVQCPKLQPASQDAQGLRTQHGSPALIEKGATLEEVLAVDEDALLQTLGIPISHARLKCALLSLSTLRIGLRAYQEDGA